MFCTAYPDVDMLEEEAMNATSFPAIKSVITSASLREEENVSGISSVVSDTLALFKDGRDINFKHLRAAARDKDGNLKRIFNSAASVINFGACYQERTSFISTRI